MSDKFDNFSRRSILKAGAASAFVASTPMFFTSGASAAEFCNTPTGSTVTLGFNVPQTGAYADEGADELRAYKLAVKHLNGEGDGGMMNTFKPSVLKGNGILGKKVAFVTGDTQTKSDAARASAKRMIEKDGAVMITGGSSSGVAIAVQGLCLAGGSELMLAADICFAAETAQFGDQHAQFGLIPGWGGSQRLTRLMGQRRALDLMFSARWLKADEAKEAGLVNYIVPDDELHGAAQEYCQKMATRSRNGIAEMKRLAREGADMTIDQQMRLERDAAVRALPSNDVAEGLDAFENRRAPEFKS